MALLVFIKKQYEVECPVFIYIYLKVKCFIFNLNRTLKTTIIFPIQHKILNDLLK